MLIYGKWSKEEFLEKQRSNSVFAPFKDGPNWYRVKELSIGFLEVKFQAEQVEEPEPSLEVESLESKPVPALEIESLEPSKPKVTTVLVSVPSNIRVWARKKGLLPLKGRGPSLLPQEVLDAYSSEFGKEALLDVLSRESLDSRREYQIEPDSKLYSDPANKERAKQFSIDRNRERAAKKSV